MKTPWTRLTGLHRAAAILASILGISLGLCGVNAVVLSGVHGTGPSGTIFVVTAFMETALILVSAVGLVIVLLLFILQAVRSAIADRSRRRGNS